MLFEAFSILFRPSPLARTARPVPKRIYVSVFVGKVVPVLAFSLASLGISISAQPVLHVVRLGSKVQVGWIDALRVVAPMKDLEPARYFSEVYFPRHTMGVFLCPRNSANPFPNPHPSVSEYAFASRPLPAFGFFRNQNVTPKSFCYAFCNHVVSRKGDWPGFGAELQRGTKAELS